MTEQFLQNDVNTNVIHSDESDNEMGDSDKLSRAELRERFWKYLSFKAEGSDVELLSRKSVAASRAIHLGSEDRSESPESLTFSTTKSIINMIKVWWEEFKERDGDTGSMNLKLKQMFRGLE